MTVANRKISDLPSTPTALQTDKTIVETALGVSVQRTYAAIGVPAGTEDNLVAASPALQLSSSYAMHRIATCASGMGVRMPPAAANALHYVRNDGANPLTVLGADVGSPSAYDTIDGVAGNTGITIPPATGIWFACVTAAKWVTTGLHQSKVLRSLWVPAASMTARTTNGAASGTAEMTTNKNMAKTLDFDGTTQQFAQFDIAMPKSWDEGTVTFQPFWSHAGAGSPAACDVVWGLDAVAVRAASALDVAFGAAQTVPVTGKDPNTLYSGTVSSAITIAGAPQPKDYVMFRVHRDPADAADNMAANARLHGVTLFYYINSTDDT